MDFTLKLYRKLLEQLISAGYAFQSFSEFLIDANKKVVVLRHDVDAKKGNSLQFAKIENELGLKGTYYFRMVPQSYDENVMRKITEFGHEIGYHYEDMDFALLRKKEKEKRKKYIEEDLYEEAYQIFQENLGKLRELYPVKTICMHGSPRSAIDNKSLWKKYSYRDLGIIGEPYFDIDFNEVFYLTDTGRRWDGEKVSIRDKVNKTHKLSFRSTNEIITAAEKNALPDKIMFTFHPQRWTNNPVAWLWELGFQNLKNQVKKHIVKKRSKTF